MSKILVRLVAFLAVLGLAGVTTGSASAQPGSPGGPLPPDNAGPPTTNGYERGQAAVARLGDRLPAVAKRYGLEPWELQEMLLEDSTMAVDSGLEIAYFDVLAPGEVSADDTETLEAVAAPPVDGPEFQLASLPGAAKTIYLDFDGHVTSGTTWNSAYNVATIESPPFDLDGDTNTWTAAELQRIVDTWSVVAEDFAPWNVNVTTIDPGANALSRTGSGDTSWGTRVVITADTFAGCGCGGHAYIGSFGDSVDEPVFVYNESFRGVSEATTHEVGHAMLLAHDGTTTGNPYYTGHGTGETSWAPIMGAAYYVNVGQWSRQDYTNANNNGSGANYGEGRDDIGILSSLTNVNGFGLRSDDHGDAASQATPLIGDTPSVEGLIATRTDVDVFSFSTGGGTATFTASPAALGANLDIALLLRNSSGQQVAFASDPATLGASLTAALEAGDYTVEVDGVGTGDPMASSPTGYTDYGSLGVYTLSGTFDSTPPPPPPPPADDAFANGEQAIAGSVSQTYVATTTADGQSQTITEVLSGGKPSRRHDTLDHQWTITSPGNVQTLSIIASVTDGGDADAGITLQWSDDGSSWVTLDTLTGSVDNSYLLGSPSGTIWVRVVDTDSSARQTSPDSIAVDLLKISSEEAGDPTTALVSAISTSTASAGRGMTYGQVNLVIENELGQPVANASVEISFTGSFADTATITTDANGRASYTTANAAKKPTFGVCIDDVIAAGLSYTSGQVCRSN